MQHEDIFGPHKVPGITGGHRRDHDLWKTDGKLTHYGRAQRGPHRPPEAYNPVNFPLGNIGDAPSYTDKLQNIKKNSAL